MASLPEVSRLHQEKVVRHQEVYVRPCSFTSSALTTGSVTVSPVRRLEAGAGWRLLPSRSVSLFHGQTRVFEQVPSRRKEHLSIRLDWLQMTGSTTSFFSVSSVPSVSSACRSACSWFSSPKLLSLSVYLPSVLLFSFLSPGLPFLLSPGATPSLAPLGNCCPRAAARQRFASSRRLSVCASFVPSSLSVAFSSFPRRRKSAMHVGSFATSQRPDWAAGKLGTPLYPFSSSPLSSSAPSPPCSRSLSSSSSSSPSSSDEFSSSPRSPYRLQRAATSSAFGLPINCLHFDQLDSTQKWCLRSLQTLRDEHGLSPSLWVAVSATRQTAAVGTRHSGTHEEKKWVSPVNNVSVTYVIPWPVSLTSRLLNFAQTASAAVCKVLEEYQIRGQIKWINDVLVDGRKISGVLCHNPAFFLPSSPSTALATNDTHPVGGNLSAQGVQSLHAGDSTRQQYIAVLVGIGINVEKNPDLSSGGGSPTACDFYGRGVCQGMSRRAPKPLEARAVFTPYRRATKPDSSIRGCQQWGKNTGESSW